MGKGGRIPTPPGHARGTKADPGRPPIPSTVAVRYRCPKCKRATAMDAGVHRGAFAVLDLWCAGCLKKMDREFVREKDDPRLPPPEERRIVLP